MSQADLSPTSPVIQVAAGRSRPGFNLCVFCASSPGKKPGLTLLARSLGRMLAERGHGLIYGGAAVGLMAEVANAVLEGDGWVEGVIPEGLFAVEVAHTSLTHMYVTDSMHSRKAKMAELASAFVALPGGFGTLDELFEILTWAQLGIHHKPIALVNADGYYTPLLQFLQRGVADGLLNPAHLALLRVYETLGEMLDGLVAAAPDKMDISRMGPGMAGMPLKP